MIGEGGADFYAHHHHHHHGFGGGETTESEEQQWLLTELPENFEPSNMDCIVGWARQNYHHGT
jgi:hypothetical protein